MLSSRQILEVWEVGRVRQPLDRALLLLVAAGAETDPADWPLAERDRRLLGLREGVFGAAMPVVARCPECGAALELELDAVHLAAALPSGAAGVCRAVTSRDLAAVAGLPAGEAMGGLRARVAGGGSLAGGEAARVEAAIEADLGAAELATSLECAECGHAWRETLDVVSLVWAEMEQAALAVLRDVADLARAFGWAERDVLALSPARRAAYLALAGAA